MRPAPATSAALVALLALIGPNNTQPCMCHAFVASTQLPVRNRDGGTATTGRSNRRPTRARPRQQRRRQNNSNGKDLVQLQASSSHGRYDHLHANARAAANPNNRMYTPAQAETAEAVADQFIEEYLQSLPSLRRHSGDAVVQRSVEAVRRAIASYLMGAGNGDDNIAGNIGATNASPVGTNAAALPYGTHDADPSSAQQQLPSAAQATSNAQAAAHQAEAALTDYLDGLSSGQFVSTPSSAEAVGAIRSYLDSLAAVENEAASGTTASNGNGGFGQSSYLQSFSPAAGATPAPYNENETTINIASTTNIQNANALADISGEDGVIAKSVHEEDGGDTTTETTVAKEGDDTVLTITSTTRIVLPKE